MTSQTTVAAILKVSPTWPGPGAEDFGCESEQLVFPVGLGSVVASGLGLKSTLFAVHMEQADVAPAPPAPADLIQVPPDQLVPPSEPAPIVDPGPLPSGPVKAILPGTGHDRARWIALAILLIPCWCLAATYYGYGMVPAEAQKFLAAQHHRFWPWSGAG